MGGYNGVDLPTAAFFLSLKEMSHLKYKNIGSPQTRLIEECAEAIFTICKAERFGWNNHHPDHPNLTNIEALKNEIDDINEAFKDLLVCLNGGSSNGSITR